MTTASRTAPKPIGMRLLSNSRGLTRRSPTFAAGLIIVGFFAFLSFFASWVAPFNPIQVFPDSVLTAPCG